MSVYKIGPSRSAGQCYLLR